MLSRHCAVLILRALNSRVDRRISRNFNRDGSRQVDDERCAFAIDAPRQTIVPPSASMSDLTLDSP